jgi:hypothetical protein
VHRALLRTTATLRPVDISLVYNETLSFVALRSSTCGRKHRQCTSHTRGRLHRPKRNHNSTKTLGTQELSRIRRLDNSHRGDSHHRPQCSEYRRRQARKRPPCLLPRCRLHRRDWQIQSDQPNCTILGAFLHQDFSLFAHPTGQKYCNPTLDIRHCGRNDGFEYGRRLCSASGRVQSGLCVLEQKQWAVSATNVPYIFYMGASWYVCFGMRDVQGTDGVDIIPGISVFTDLLCALLPFPILWDLQLCPRKKVAVGSLMALGGM